jgi:dTDP-4-dehydrorhamnose reductase
MNQPRILLLGKNGQVGWELRRTLAPLGEVVAVDFPEVDFTRPDSLRQWVRDTQPQVILNAAAHTAVDKAEKEPELALAINGTAPGILAEEARRIGAWVVHYSTDYVYGGDKGTPYVETDPTHPLGAYGRSKVAGDEAVQAAEGLYLIFRLCWVYGLRGQNFLLTIQRLARERERLRVVADQVGCPTWSRLIAETTALALAKTLRAPDPAAYQGVYHLAVSSWTSWHGFAEAIVKLMRAEERKCTQVEAIPTSEYPLPARRPAWSVLSCEKLERTFGFRLPDWEDTLRLALEG